MSTQPSKKETPISSLDESSLSQKYNNAYWIVQEENNSPIWQQAVKVCKKRNQSEYPNCSYINNLVWGAVLQNIGTTMTLSHNPNILQTAIFNRQST